MHMLKNQKLFLFALISMTAAGVSGQQIFESVDSASTIQVPSGQPHSLFRFLSR